MSKTVSLAIAELLDNAANASSHFREMEDSRLKLESNFTFNNAASNHVLQREAQVVLLNMAQAVVADGISPMYRMASQKNGGFVVVDRKFSYLPFLEGKDGKVVFVYEIVEEIEAVLDFRELHSFFPELTYPQIVGAVGFLRSLSQFNRKGMDLDALYDQTVESDPRFQKAVAEAMEDKEVVRVLAPL